MGEHRSASCVQVEPRTWRASCHCGADFYRFTARDATEAVAGHVRQETAAGTSMLVRHLLLAAAHLSRARNLAAGDELLAEAIGLDVDDVHRLLTVLGRRAGDSPAGGV